jgi:O-methyltransferase involved in polyketide biosynthesis
MELNNESKTMFIPLYGKALMSKENIFLKDLKAEEIVSKVNYDFKSLKQSKWLSMYMSLRSLIIDELCNKYILEHPNSTVIHLGCGLDSRNLRVNQNFNKWYDVDFESVIDIRKEFYENIVKRNPSQKVFLKGWMNRLNDYNWV